ncbi:TonB-dependent receptor [Sphingobacterium wenxiniae]|uniref:Iron complex outermembrane recepter protein n=1 Tax=Sphingobacterium wenxiniae TaxID=683125 RepID=A0A1I6PCV2_9SPHI|nr:TonB-dependent receptor [Sphingobacterium wenxiniae]SFS37993.1 iron complex outermembrane recepter protein [Sphingobacterium wenxiniae]
MIKHLLALCCTCFFWSVCQAQVADTISKDSLGFGHIHLQDVVITGKQMQSLSASLHRLSQVQMREQKGNLLAESLSQLSGLSTIGMGNSIVKPVINGLHGNRILLLNQGVRQEGQQWGVEHAPEIDPFVADKLEVIKGAQGVRYGADALGGVILITADDIDSHKAIAGEINTIGQSNSRSLTLNGELEGGVVAIPNLGWRIQASGKKAGNYRAADYYLGNTGAKELNYSGTLQYQQEANRWEAYYSHFGTTLGIFRGAHIATAEDIEARIAHGRPYEDYAFSYDIEAPRQTVTHDLAKLQWKRQLRGEQSLEVLYAFQHNHRKEFDLRRIAADDTPMADMVLTTQNLDISYKVKGLSVGTQTSIQVNNNTPGTGTTPIIPNFDSYTLSAYAIQQLHFGRLHTEGGLRYDYKHLDMAGYRYDYAHPNADGSLNQYLMTDNRQFHNVSGTFGILYHILPHFNWKSNIGLAWRAPSANELYSDGVHHGSGTYEVGNKNLVSEKGLKWVNSLIWNTEKWQATVDAYAQMVYDYIYAQPHSDSVRQTIRGTFPLFSYEQHDAFFYGVDLSASFTLNEQLGYHIKASLVRAKNTTLNSYLPYIPADRWSHAIQWEPTYAPLRNAYIKFTHRFVAEQARYEDGTDYTAPPSAYHLFDLVLSKHITMPEERNLQVLLSVNNLFNTSYKDYMDRFRYFAHQMGRNIQVKLSYQF